MNILIIGGTRFIGKAITNECLSRGYNVTLYNRGKSKNDFDVESITGDINELVTHKDNILSRNFDAVIHCIAFSEKHSNDLLEVFQGTRTRLLALSSCDCYEAFQGLNRLEDRNEIPVYEHSTLSQQKFYWSDLGAKGEMATEYDKNLMTSALMESFQKELALPTVFRLPMVYGPGDNQYPSRHGDFIQRILADRRTVLLSAREQCQVYTYGYVENIASAIIHSLDHDKTIGQIYNLGEQVSRTRRKWAELYGSVIGWKFNFEILPEEIIREERAYRNAPPQHMVTVSDKFREHTGFSEPVSLEEAIQRTFSFAKEYPEVLGEKPNYILEDKYIAHYHKCLNSFYQSDES